MNSPKSSFYEIEDDNMASSPVEAISESDLTLEENYFLSTCVEKPSPELLAYYGLNMDICKAKSHQNGKYNPRCYHGLKQQEWLLGDGKVKGEEDEDGNFNFAGLDNLGSTCYINTFLQLWFHNVPIRKAFYNWRTTIPSDSHEQDFMGMLQLVFALMQFSTAPSVNPSMFIESMNVNKNRQGDTHEFSSFFLDAIQNKLGNNEDKSLINVLHDQFLIKLAHITRCDTCQIGNSTTSNCFEISLHIKSFTNLASSLAAYFEEEAMDGDNRYQCENCNQLRDAHRSVTITRYPKMLNLQLLRFESCMGQSRKVKTSLEFPKVLDLANYIKQNENEAAEELVNDHHARQEQIEAKYNLHAVLVHHGETTDSGHYIIYIQVNDSWYEFNDQKVKKLKDLNKILAGKKENGLDDENTANVSSGDNEMDATEYNSKTAYTLIYKLSEENFTVEDRTNQTEEEINKSMIAWNLPQHTRKMVKHMNDVRLQISARLAASEAEQQAERQIFHEMIKNIYGCMPTEIGVSNYDFISKYWLASMFNGNRIEDVPMVDNDSIMCVHNRLKASSQFKAISTKSADYIYGAFSGGPRLKVRMDALCWDCYENHLQLDTFKAGLNAAHKRITQFIKCKPELGENLIWVGKNSLRWWRSLAIKRYFEVFDNQAIPITKCKLTYFNQDIFCEHGSLGIDDSKRRLVNSQVLGILDQYFDLSMMLDETDVPCTLCLELDRSNQELENKMAEMARDQKEALIELFTRKIKIRWSEVMMQAMKGKQEGRKKRKDKEEEPEKGSEVIEEPVQRYHLLSMVFYENWRRFIIDESEYTLPKSISNEDLLCIFHSRLLFPVGDETYLGYDSHYVLLPEAEWIKLSKFYSIDRDVVVESRLDEAGNLKIEPTFCAECFEMFKQDENARQYIYECATITIQMANLLEFQALMIKKHKEKEGELSNGSESGGDVSPKVKRAKVDSEINNGKENKQPIDKGIVLRRSKRQKKNIHLLKLKVASTDKLNDIKVKIKAYTQIDTPKQLLLHKDKLLTLQENDLSLTELKIGPGANIVLLLTYDAMKEKQPFIYTKW